MNNRSWNLNERNDVEMRWMYCRVKVDEKGNCEWKREKGNYEWWEVEMWDDEWKVVK